MLSEEALHAQHASMWQQSNSICTFSVYLLMAVVPLSPSGRLLFVSSCRSLLLTSQKSPQDRKDRKWHGVILVQLEHLHFFLSKQV